MQRARSAQNGRHGSSSAGFRPSCPAACIPPSTHQQLELRHPDLEAQQLLLVHKRVCHGARRRGRQLGEHGRRHGVRGGRRLDRRLPPAAAGGGRVGWWGLLAPRRWLCLSPIDLGVTVRARCSPKGEVEKSVVRAGRAGRAERSGAGRPMPGSAAPNRQEALSLRPGGRQQGQARDAQTQPSHANCIARYCHIPFTSPGRCQPPACKPNAGTSLRSPTHRHSSYSDPKIHAMAAQPPAGKPAAAAGPPGKEEPKQAALVCSKDPYKEPNVPRKM